MERLPDRPDVMRDESPATNTDAGNAKKQSKKDKFKTYSFLILIVVLLFILMQKNEVPLDHITVNDWLEPPISWLAPCLKAKNLQKPRLILTKKAVSLRLRFMNTLPRLFWERATL